MLSKFRPELVTACCSTTWDIYLINLKLILWFKCGIGVELRRTMFLHLSQHPWAWLLEFLHFFYVAKINQEHTFHRVNSLKLYIWFIWCKPVLLKSNGIWKTDRWNKFAWPLFITRVVDWECKSNLCLAPSSQNRPCAILHHRKGLLGLSNPR